MSGRSFGHLFRAWGFPLFLGLSGICRDAEAAGLSGVFDAGWSTGYYGQNSLTHMHQRLHEIGARTVILQYAAVEGTHLYYPSVLDFLQNTTYRHDDFFEKSLKAARAAGNNLWLGLYYNGNDWYTPPTTEALDTLAARNIKVLEELYSQFGGDSLIEGVYIPQEIARYYWDGLRSDATTQGLASHFLEPVTKAAQAKGWKVMAAPFFNRKLESPATLQGFFENLFKAGFKPDVIAVQDGIGASDGGVHHATLDSLGLYLRAVASACQKHDIEFWVDEELFESTESSALAPQSRIQAQLDTAKAAGAVQVVGYDLAVLKNEGLDSLKNWFGIYEEPTSIRRGINEKPRPAEAKPIRYWKLNGARATEKPRYFK